MNFSSHIIFDSNTNLYKLINGSWFNAWDFTNNAKIYDFGFKLLGNELIFESNFDILNLNNHQYTLINSKELSIQLILNDTGIYSFIFDFSVNDLPVCNDTNGDLMDSYVFKDDGVIYNGSTNISLSSVCCSNLGFRFNPNLNKCFWVDDCSDLNSKLYLNTNGSEGSIFDVNNSEECTLNINFDYLIEVNCNQLISQNGVNNVINSLSGISITMSLERLVNRELSETTLGYIFESPKKMDVVYTNTLFNGLNLLDKLQLPNSGIKIIGDCNSLINNLTNQLLNVYNLVLNPDSLNSNWYNFNLTITDPALINLIKNEEIKIGFNLDNIGIEISMLIDNVKIDKLCNYVEINSLEINNCPNFKLEKVIDNKKSWVVNEVYENRIFDLVNSETNYEINNSKLALNSKEINLNLNMARAIEFDVMNYIDTNSCTRHLLDDFILGYKDFINVENFNKIINSNFIDVKSRKTISVYPVLRKLFDGYVASLNNCNIQSNGYNYDLIFDYIINTNYNWVDLVEQLIPSTTLWGSTYKFGNTIFDNNKFVYKKYSLFSCERIISYPIIGYENIEITKKIDNSTEKCNSVYIYQIDDGSEFLGKITILGDPNFVNDEIILNNI
jgi:hypothetical protein